MTQRYVLAAALRTLPAAKAAFFSAVADDLDRRPDVVDRLHLLYPVLAAAAPSIEPVLDRSRMVEIAAAFVRRRGDRIAAILYSETYLRQGSAAFAALATELQADAANAVLEDLAAGRIAFEERTVWRFHSETSDAAFPFLDDSDEG